MEQNFRRIEEAEARNEHLHVEASQQKVWCFKLG